MFNAISTQNLNITNYHSKDAISEFNKDYIPS